MYITNSKQSQQQQQLHSSPHGSLQLLGTSGAHQPKQSDLLSTMSRTRISNRKKRQRDGNNDGSSRIKNVGISAAIVTAAAAAVTTATMILMLAIPTTHALQSGSVQRIGSRSLYNVPSSAVAYTMRFERRSVVLTSLSSPSSSSSSSLFSGGGDGASNRRTSTTTTTTTTKDGKKGPTHRKPTSVAASAAAAAANDDELKKRWISWMTFGKLIKTATPSMPSAASRRGAGELKLREAEELGGIARSERYSSSDWWHNTLSLPNSAILKAIRGPVLFMTAWSGFLSVLYRRLLVTDPAVAQLMSLPQAPHSLMISALSLLLVFKTNAAYQRFSEGRKIWENIINNARDLYRMMNLYENEIGRPKRRRLQRLLAAFPYLLRHRIRPNLVMYRLDDVSNIRDPVNSILLYQDKAANDLDPEAAAVATQEENDGKSRRKRRQLFWVDKRTLPWRLLPPNALESCARAQNRPLWVCDRMAQELRNIPDGPNFTARERLALIAKVDKLSGSIGACERIHQTAVPLNYARHSLRALTLWLFTLPFCLIQSLKLLTAPAIFLLSWMLFGVYQIGYSIEDPFQGTLRLSVLCDSIRRDVLADEVIRSTAFEIRDPDTNPQHESVGQDATIGSHKGKDGNVATKIPTKTGSSVTSAAGTNVNNNNDDDDDPPDYESSPIGKGSKRTKKLGDGGWRVEELPEIPIKGNSLDPPKP